jgi:hypothetical protein
MRLDFQVAVRYGLAILFDSCRTKENFHDDEVSVTNEVVNARSIISSSIKTRDGEERNCLEK